MDDGGQTVDHNPSLLEQTVSMISFAALAAQTWELLVSFTDEVEYLWGGKFNFVKGLYFCSRYAMLVAQIVNQLLSFRFQERASHPSHICPGIFVYKTIISQMSLSLVEMILLIRVYVLCNQSYKAKRLLLLVFSLTTVLETTGTAIVCHSLAQESGCMPPEPNKKGMTIFGIGAGFCQAVIFATTVTKFLARGRAGWTRTPLVSLMLRDGLVTFFSDHGSSECYDSVRNYYPQHRYRGRKCWFRMVHRASLNSSVSTYPQYEKNCRYTSWLTQLRG